MKRYDRELHFSGRLGLAALCALLCSCQRTETYPTQYRGVWSGTLQLVEDQCHREIEQLVVRHAISVDGDKVILTTEEERYLTGETTDEQTFIVQEVYNSPLSTLERVQYSSIKDGVAEAEMTFVQMGAGGCTSKWQGRVEQQ